MATVADEVMRIFAERGEDAYFGEDVSQLEHALQAGYFASQAGATQSLVVAALVHDIGHLVGGKDEDIADQGVDARHEEVGRQWLAARFPKDVFEPVCLHVSAKRYLCAAEPAYLGKLSPASVQSLKLQGGPMSTAEAKDFEANEFYREAIELRQWDDQAKIAGFTTPPLEAYRTAIDEVASKTV